MVKTKAKGFERYNRYAYLFLLPFIIGFVVFQLYPILYTIVLSFSDLRGWQTDFQLIGSQNYLNLLNNELFRKSIANTFIIWTMNFLPQILLSLVLAAWFTSLKLKLKGTGFFKIVFYLPNIITAASVAVLFYALFSYPMGPMNLVLQGLKLIDQPVDFFRQVGVTRGIVAFIQFWMWYGQTMIVLISGILSISDTLFESAMVDGATDRQLFRYITIPLLRPILLYTMVTSLIGGLQIFDIPFLLTGGNPDNSVLTVTMYIYKQAFEGNRNLNMASAASVILLLISVVLSLIMFRLFKERQVKGGA
ncbi:sugar ABC transporter permease [Vagococcus sp. BWB3-3]|uniref:Sugar ABC transporter permease n=1 Tax=Vagococcus allomyrinae TaxID=2794353 RepID=A0A940PEA7_9ENTE|nr:sugar ABC transporter permease [Vagococcus allomyrinae]MBP1042393.1 sugar ABC transporter permease [Vagococcus allomyrinae]